MSIQTIAEKHSASCFLNSLFREWTHFKKNIDSSSFVIEINADELLVIPVEYFSLIGRHEYGSVFFVKNKFNEKIVELNFSGLVRVLLTHLSKEYKTTPEHISIFIKRIENSLGNIKAALDLRSDELDELYKKEIISFKEAEQALIVGHTFHPNPKSRDEFSDDDYKKYAPEMLGSFLLHWFLVRPEILYQQVSNNFENKKWAEELFLKDFKNHQDLLTKGYIPFPVHPWQKEVILKEETIQDYLNTGLMIDLEEASSQDKWHPTSSLRSIYNEVSPFMLKFSLSVRLTNSIRHLLPLEVVRGLQVMDVFSTQNGASFLEKSPNFNVVYEPAFFALTDKDKKIMNETIVAMRLNPFQGHDGDQKIVLATLTQEHPLKGMSLIGNMITRENKLHGSSLQELGQEWFNLFLENAVKPLMMAQANYGIYLGAHQQNLILEIKNNRPVKAFFRDCQGTGYSHVGFELFSNDVDLMTMDNGNILDAKMGNVLFAYYLIINSTFNVITAIAKDVGIPEESLVSSLRKHLKKWRQEGVKDSSCLDYLLDQKELLQKGNFLCSFVNMNENTTQNPLSIYNSISNPLYEG